MPVLTFRQLTVAIVGQPDASALRNNTKIAEDYDICLCALCDPLSQSDKMWSGSDNSAHDL
ncbi:hypothetical protein C4E15_11100 [Achromobacter spanius]|uniref:Uncharacterized protein n=1 Tax=Achromobacter spanius TaxID=217203 RepID=A0A2S5GTD2_9BURK|nr:hypothetical protein DVB37_04615 [Achromobacter sp. B7]PPA76208.1 hypothetical protein C4E15_11100 [Achromobacter spanius]HCQ46914.1 hypothetical protein [Achromobacter sp.]